MSKEKSKSKQKRRVKKPFLEEIILKPDFLDIHGFAQDLATIANNISDKEELTIEELQEWWLNKLAEDENPKTLLLFTLSEISSKIERMRLRARVIVEVANISEPIEKAIKDSWSVMSKISNIYNRTWKKIWDSKKQAILIFGHYLRACKLASKHSCELQTFAARLEIEIELEQYPILSGSQPVKKNKGEKPDVPKMSKEARVLAVLVEHSNWSNAKIAKEAGVSRSGIYKMENFRKAREIQKKEGKKNIPRGSKSEKTGRMEAWDEE